MKRVFRRKKAAAISAGASGLILLLCAGLAFVLDPAFLFTLVFPGLVGLLFGCLAVIEYRGALELDERGIRFHYRIFSKSKDMNRSGVFLPYDRIDHVQKIFLPGDGVFAKDTVQYRFFLTDRQQTEVYFYHFGPEAEKEILALIGEKVAMQP